jgi:hypothetical protein
MPQGRHYWHLAVLAALFDSSASIIGSSFTSQDFYIQISTTVSLTVKAPYSVSVTVDGVKQSGAISRRIWMRTSCRHFKLLL